VLEREEPGRPCIEGGRIQSANVELGARIRIRGWERGRGRRDVAAAASECDGEGGSRLVGAVRDLARACCPAHALHLDCSLM